MKESLLDLAYRVLYDRRAKNKKKKTPDPLPFSELWEAVLIESGRDPETAEQYIGEFYTNLVLDQRFAPRGDNTWDLRQFYTLKEVSANQDFYTEDDADEQEEDIANKDLLGINEIDSDIIAEDDEVETAEIRITDVTEIDY